MQNTGLLLCPRSYIKDCQTKRAEDALVKAKANVASEEAVQLVERAMELLKSKHSLRPLTGVYDYIPFAKEFMRLILRQLQTALLLPLPLFPVSPSLLIHLPLHLFLSHHNLPLLYSFTLHLLVFTRLLRFPLFLPFYLITLSLLPFPIPVTSGSLSPEN
ncbi:unnamed protein product [Dibothriocephalus latus]|uniref:Uncharacterized protein n=1 Tax=Dibothriocephalus latus TaxID=60516 RepID=A0A3P7Q0G4_DIBLA|nr:unnamed protein product [Dibothriocephalus latus]